MAALAEVEWEECFLPAARDPELERELRAMNGGMLPPGTPYFVHCPWVARAAVHYDWLMGRLIHVPPDLAEQIAVVVSQDNSCRYCFAAHRLFLRFTGVPEPRIRRLEQDLLTADLRPPERAALEFARQVSRAGPVVGPEEVEALLEVGWSDAAIREIALVAGFMLAANRYATLAALPPQRIEEVPERWYVRAVVPLAGRFVRRRWRRGGPDFLEPERRTGPFAPAVNAFDGLPLGRSLRTVLDEAWASPLLSRRAKALIFAVVARGLGAPSAEREAARLAAAEGLAKDALEPALAYLAAPGLDPVEAQLAPFARETLWYQPAPLQRRGRSLSQQLGPGPFLEAVGVASFANMVCRLEVFAGSAA
jgi:AhpD family alkylhydroperoxidase